MTFTFILDDKTVPITDIRNSSFNYSRDEPLFTLDIKTSSNGDFHFECSSTDLGKANALWMLSQDIGFGLRAIAEGRLKAD